MRRGGRREERQEGDADVDADAAGASRCCTVADPLLHRRLGVLDGRNGQASLLVGVRPPGHLIELLLHLQSTTECCQSAAIGRQRHTHTRARAHTHTHTTSHHTHHTRTHTHAPGNGGRRSHPARVFMAQVAPVRCDRNVSLHVDLRAAGWISALLLQMVTPPGTRARINAPSVSSGRSSAPSSAGPSASSGAASLASTPANTHVTHVHTHTFGPARP